MFQRYSQEQVIKKILKNQLPTFVYLRGRRRVGKSWLLEKITKESKTAFYFSGKLDAKNKETLKEFAQKWSVFSHSPELVELKSSLLTWSRVFQVITSYLQSKCTKTTPLLIVFDEIQWLAKEGVGFCGSLKEAWIHWEQTKSVKVIVSGSSNKFFQNKTGGEETILRGLATHAPIWLKNISPREIKKQLCPTWNLQEIALLFMFVGGIPYYLNQVNAQMGFVHAMNKAFFMKESIFIDEVDEVLKVDFNTAGIKTTKIILSAIANGATSLKRIELLTGISHTTAANIIEKNLDYGILIESSPLFSTETKKPEKTYVINDFYLNLYFKLLQPKERAIKNNSNRLIFSELILRSPTNYYIENFTGPQFERFVRYVLEESYLEYDEDNEPAVFKKLTLSDKNYVVFPFANRNCQIDLLIKHNTDRIIRLLEIKWAKEQENWIDEILKKEYPCEESYSIRRYIISGYSLSQNFINRAIKKGVECIRLEDLFFP